MAKCLLKITMFIDSQWLSRIMQTINYQHSNIKNNQHTNIKNNQHTNIKNNQHTNIKNNQHPNINNNELNYNNYLLLNILVEHY